MNRVLLICITAMACASLIFGFNGEGLFHKIAIFYGGWLTGWLFIVVHDEITGAAE